MDQQSLVIKGMPPLHWSRVLQTQFLKEDKQVFDIFQTPYIINSDTTLPFKTMTEQQTAAAGFFTSTSFCEEEESLYVSSIFLLVKRREKPHNGQQILSMLCGNWG